MTLIAVSITTRQLPALTAPIRSGKLPCFSMLSNASKPFFRKWHIHLIDVVKTMRITRQEARTVMQALRHSLGKSTRDVVTVEEFCAYTGLGKGFVRMHLVSRVMEHELLKQWDAIEKKYGNCTLTMKI